METTARKNFPENGTKKTFILDIGIKLEAIEQLCQVI